MKGNIMNKQNAKKKLNDVKIKFLQILEERPLETIATLSAAALAVAKVISSVNEAQNAKTWRKEVKRREQKQRMRATDYPRR
jgi:phosphoribosylanthranilate isomerase